MRLLLDESIPRPLGAALKDHEVVTVKAAGWEGVENGELLDRAAAAGYDAFITVDKGFEYQQNLARLPLTVALLRAPSNRLEDLEPLVAVLLDRLSEAEPSSFIKLDA